MNPKERQTAAAQRAVKAGITTQKDLTVWWGANCPDESLGGVIRAWRVLRPGGAAPAPRAAKSPKPAKVAKTDDLDFLDDTPTVSKKVAAKVKTAKPKKVDDDLDFLDDTPTKPRRSKAKPEMVPVGPQSGPKNSPMWGQWECAGCQRTFGRHEKQCAYC